MFAQFIFQFNSSVHSLFDYYLIIVWLSFSSLILEMYSRYFNPVINNHLLSQKNIIQDKTCLLSS